MNEAYAVCRPWAVSTFSDCKFIDNCEIQLRASCTFNNCELEEGCGILIQSNGGATLTNCKYNNELITSENVATLLGTSEGITVSNTQ